MYQSSIYPEAGDRQVTANARCSAFLHTRLLPSQQSVCQARQHFRILSGSGAAPPTRPAQRPHVFSPAKILARPQLQLLSPERLSLPQSWVCSRCKCLAERPPRNCSRSGPPKASVMFAVGQVVASTDSEPSPAVAVQLQPHSRWQRASRSSEKSLSAESVPSKSIKTARSGSVALRSDRLTTAGSRLISLQGPTPPARESLQCM